MKTNIEDISSVKKKVSVEIEAEEIDRRIEDAYKRLGKKAKIKGFRAGKVPRNILEKFYSHQVLEDVTNDVIRETLPSAIDETKKFPLTMPTIENDEELKGGHSFKYSALMEIRPEFELKDYSGIEIEKEKCIVTDEDVRKQIEQIRESRGTLVSITEERGVKEGDYIILDFEAVEGDKPIEEIKSSNFPLKVGSRQFYQGVEDALIGIKKGAPTEIKVDFDKDYFHPKLAGKSVTFKVEVTEIKEISLPELNDEFIKGLGGEVKDLDDFKQKIKEEMTAGEEKRIDSELKARLLRKIADAVEFELPESLVEYEVNSSVENIKQRLVRSGASLEKSGFDESKVREDIRPNAEKGVKQLFVIGEIARQKSITVDEKDMEDGFRKMSMDFGTDQGVIRQYYESNDLVDSFRQGLLREKTLNHLVENARIIETDPDKIKDK
jgi:trigger factor